MKDIISEVQVTYSSTIKNSKRIKIQSSRDAEKAFREFWPGYEHVEYSYLLLLNQNNQLLGRYFLGKGGITGTVVDVRVIFQVAIKTNATAIILGHNHPSGNVMPSEGDKRITHQIKEAGKLLEISLLDHIILTEQDYKSFADKGYL